MSIATKFQISVVISHFAFCSADFTVATTKHMPSIILCILIGGHGAVLNRHAHNWLKPTSKLRSINGYMYKTGYDVHQYSYATVYTS